MHTLLLLAVIYGTLVGGNFSNAPSTVIYDNGVHVTAYITEPQANALGYKMLVDEPPACASNEYAVAVGYTEDTRILRVYEKRTIVPAPRRFYKYDVSAACDEVGELDNFIALVSADAKTKWFYDNAEILVENDPFFVGVTNAVISSGSMSEEKVKRILDRAYELGHVTSVK